MRGAETAFDRLVKYRKEHPGSWPSQDRESSFRGLGRWCVKQRYLRKLGRLSPRKIAALNSIDFPWDPYESAWKDNYQALIAYRRQHPNRWPAATEVVLGNKLGSWCVHQRQQMKFGRLDHRRKILLEKISFPWEFEVEDLTGRTFSRLKVLSVAGSNKEGKRLWLCLCSCGRKVKSTSYRLSSSKHKSCGCLLREKAAARMPAVQRISSQKRLLSAKQVQERIDRVHGEGTISLVPSTFKGVFSPAKFIHRIHGEWQTKPISVYRGSSHPIDARSRTNMALEARRLTEEEVNKRLPDYLRIKPGTFISTQKKAVFVDAAFGEWTAAVSNVLGGHGHPKRGIQRQLGAMERTNLRKYGVKYVAQVARFALRAAENQNKIVRKRHWKTREIVRCHGGWEALVVDYLNKHRINYAWQPQVFSVPMEVLATPRGNETTYRPDLFLIDENKWVEIKGYFREDAMKKWAWFCGLNPNSELWDLRKLQNLGIL